MGEKARGEIIYVSSNREDNRFEEKIRQNILSVTNLPIISVTQKPVNFGRNIVVGNVGVSGFNMFRQILIGLKASDADYVIGCESDCLYPPDYFEFVPPDLRTVYRSDKTFILPYKRGCFYGKPNGTSLCQIIGREYYIEILESLFESAPTWTTGEKSFPKERRGQYDIIKKNEIKYFSHSNPIISFKTGKGMRHLSNGQGEDVCNLPYWGTADFIRRKYVELAQMQEGMKNLMIFTNKEERFTKEVETLVKVQIDNSLYFWKPDDIILFTNFSYEYNGVRAKVIPGVMMEIGGSSNKIPIISYLLKNDMLPDDTIWYHDFDAYQDDIINVDTDISFTPYGWNPTINLGSFFFKPGEKAKSIFDLISKELVITGKTDERTLIQLIRENRISGYDVLGIEYNYGPRLHNFPEFDKVKPKILHFHPVINYKADKEANLDIFMYGKNKFNRPLMSKRLIDIFKKHGVVKNSFLVSNDSSDNVQKRGDIYGNAAIFSSHNATVAVEKNGKIVGVIELERFLSSKNVGLHCCNPAKVYDKSLWSYLRTFIKEEYNISSFKTLYVQPCSDKKEAISYSRFFDNAVEVITKHHESHANGTFYQSPYDRAIVVSFDGGGDDGYFNIYKANRRDGVRKIESVNIDMGYIYYFFGKFLADIKKSKDGNLVYAGKMMGLCAYGNVIEEWLPGFIDVFLKCKSVKGGGYHRFLQRELSKIVGKEFDIKKSFEGQFSWDIAATAQRAFEDVFIKLTKETIDKYPDLPICLTGGCAMNIILNTRIKNMGKNVFVAPNANDSGIAIGMLLGQMKPKDPIDVTYLGIPILDKYSLMVYAQNNKYRSRKQLPFDLRDGKIVGVVVGNSEHGPRALGNRSILCNPTISEMKDNLNGKVKNREWYRPFAPVVRLEDVSKYFEWEGESRWMSFCPKVKEEYRKLLPAITHVDGTARVQTVTKTQNEFLYNTLSEFNKLTGIGVLLNTSFNVAGKPLVSTYSEAWKMYTETGMDCLMLEGLYFRKQDR